MEKINWKRIHIDKKRTRYLVSNTGLVYSECSKKILKPNISNCGYQRVTLYISNKKSVHVSVHRLVAIAFIKNPDEKPQVNHKDGVKTHNSVDNLEWCYPYENNKHAYLSGLKHSKQGDESHLAKYKKCDVIFACELMQNGCNTLSDISKITSIDKAMLYRIYKRLSWVNVSKYYDVENCLSNYKKYTISELEQVFSLLEQDEYSLYDISDMTGVKYSSVHNILIRRHTKSIDYLYDIYDVTRYTKNKIMPDFCDAAKMYIEKMLLDDATVKDIAEYINKKYGYNLDRCKHYIRRVKNKLGSTTIESIKNE